MATTASFKQQCPSCEAMVCGPRDPNLIGRKIDCPKCKYRFVVEDPEDAAEEEEKPKAKKEDEKEDKKPAKAKAKRRGGDSDEKAVGSKKKGGSNSKVLIGVFVGAVALAALGIAGYFLFAEGDSQGARSVSLLPVNTASRAPSPPPKEEREEVRG